MNFSQFTVLWLIVNRNDIAGFPVQLQNSTGKCFYTHGIGIIAHAIVQLHIGHTIPCQVWLKKSIHSYCKVYRENYHVLVANAH